MFDSLNGYGNIDTFKDMTQDEIDGVEIHARTKLVRILTKNAIDCGQELDESLMTAFFGVYGVCPEEFEFVRGDKKLIVKLTERVGEKIQSDGIDFFRSKRQRYTFKGIGESQFGLIYGDFTHRPNINVKAHFTEDDVRKKLFDSAKSVFDSFKGETENRNCAILSDEMINIVMGETKVTGEVTCIICQTHKSKQYFKTKPGSKSFCWVMTNMRSHIENCLQPKDPSTKSRKDNKKVTAKTVNDDDRDKNEQQNTGNAADDNTVIDLNETARSHTDDDELQSQYEDILTTQILVQSLKMSNTVHQCKDVEETMVCGFGTKSRQQSVQICDVPADGDCLFTSIAHQFGHVKINSEEHKKLAFSLRETVVEHIKMNISQYKHNLIDRILQNEPLLKRKEVTEPLCLSYVKTILSREGVFGGKESFDAISLMKKANIVVFNEEGTCYFGSDFIPAYTETILIAFRGSKGQRNVDRNHFGSVTSVSNHLAEAASKNLIKNYMQSIRNKNRNSVVALE